MTYRPDLISIHFITTFLLTGIAWTLQWVHYPSFIGYRKEPFPELMLRDLRRGACLMFPLMAVEAFTAVWLVWAALDFTYFIHYALGLILILILWLAIAWILIPLQRKLAMGYDENLIREFNRAQWIRTIGWTLRSILMLSVMRHLLEHSIL